MYVSCHVLVKGLGFDLRHNIVCGIRAKDLIFLSLVDFICRKRRYHLESFRLSAPWGVNYGNVWVLGASV